MHGAQTSFAVRVPALYTVLTLSPCCFTPASVTAIIAPSQGPRALTHLVCLLQQTDGCQQGNCFHQPASARIIRRSSATQGTDMTSSRPAGWLVDKTQWPWRGYIISSPAIGLPAYRKPRSFGASPTRLPRLRTVNATDKQLLAT